MNKLNFRRANPNSAYETSAHISDTKTVTYLVAQIGHGNWYTIIDDPMSGGRAELFSTKRDAIACAEDDFNRRRIVSENDPD